ncbi:MAG: adenylate/guanylate cyclase domain-containing protein [Xanthobacteraceae bacterium]|nr:adenylate/guanylate cyclase domain-containing protein [Xanthobacteraceae bacterium]
MTMTSAQLRAILRLASGLTLFTFVTCHLTAHAALLVSIPFAEAVLDALMAPWRTLAGTAVLATAGIVHYCNALWSIYRRRSLRMSRWEGWQLALGLSIPLLVALHVVSTKVATLAFGVSPSYAEALARWWVRQPREAALQFVAVIVVWTHGCIGLHFGLRTRPWYPVALVVLQPLALLLPVLALAGLVAAGTHTRREAARDPDYVRSATARVSLPGASVRSLDTVVAAVIIGHVALTLLPFGGRAARRTFTRWRRPPTLTHATGRRLAIQPGATVLETLRDNGIPHAAVCGGRARCTTCRVLVTQGLDELPPPAAQEAWALTRIQASPATRLACQICPTADLTVVPLLSADATAADGAARGGLEGSERLVTVVFVDLRGATGIGEARMPYDVLFLLNHFLREMTQALHDTHGHYSQFTGDGLMALYGLAGEPAKGTRDAIRGAGEMLARVERLNRELAAAMPQPLRIGVGIHFSEAIVGAMGPPRSQIISAIGDTVNTCARLENLTKDYDCALIISRQAAEAATLDLGDAPLHEATVKGRTGSVQFYALNTVPPLNAGTPA